MKSSITKTITLNMYIQLSFLILSILSDTENSSFECGYDGRWKSYKDEKCFRVIQTMSTRDEAISACYGQNTRSESFLPSLVTINSKQEQEFLENYLFDVLGIQDNVWIGAKRVNNSFKWNDGSDIEYNNWAQNRPTDDLSKNCAQMQSRDSSTSGEWIDSSCERKNMVVCEKLQIWSFPDLQKAFLESRKIYSELFDDLSEQLREKDERIDSLELDLQKISQQLLDISSDVQSFKSEVLSAVNNSYQYLMRDNEEIREQLRIKGTQIVTILHDIDQLKTNSSNNNNSNQIESLRAELIALINSKISELSPDMSKAVTDVRLEIINYRRTLQIKKNGEWISIGFV